MKFVLCLSFVVLIIVEISASAIEKSEYEPTTTPKYNFQVLYTLNLLETFCPRQLTPEEITYGNQNLGYYAKCFNTTMETFIQNIENYTNSDYQLDYSYYSLVQKLAEPVCEVIESSYLCIAELNPVIDMCLDDRSKYIKNKLFAIALLIQQTICVKKGTAIIELVQRIDSLRVVEKTIDTLIDIGGIELLDNETSEDGLHRKQRNIFSLRLLSMKLGEIDKTLVRMFKKFGY